MIPVIHCTLEDGMMYPGMGLCLKSTMLGYDGCVDIVMVYIYATLEFDLQLQSKSTVKATKVVLNQ